MAVRRSPLLKQSCVVALSGETARKACKKQKGVPGKPPRYATVVGPGTQPAGWGWRPTVKNCRSGPPRQCRGHLKDLAAQASWNSRASQNCACSGIEVRAGVTVAVI